MIRNKSKPILFLFILTTLPYCCWGKYETVKQKCIEYSTKCKPSKPLPLIIGGQEVSEGEFPHMALIGFGKTPEINWECGGALISENYVLSAAHCSSNRELGKASKVRFGLTDRDYKGPKLQERNILNIIVYPEYKRPIKYHDIALFQLERSIRFTDFVRPACLYPFSKVHSKDIPNAIGFGKTSFTNEEGHAKLLKVDLPILQNNICEPFYRSMKFSTLNRGGLIDSQICAGVLEGGRDTCQGDSGGPLQVYEAAPECKYYIVGITSFGKFCGYANSPAIYTKVYDYLNWIESTVWPQ